MPYCFPRSSIKFPGHTGQNITDFDPNWAFLDYRLVAAFKSLRFALLLYINDLGPICSTTTPILFADDTNLFKNGKGLNKMQDELNSELAKIYLWLKVKSFLLILVKHILWCLSTRRKDFII